MLIFFKIIIINLGFHLVDMSPTLAYIIVYISSYPVVVSIPHLPRGPLAIVFSNSRYTWLSDVSFDRSS